MNMTSEIKYLQKELNQRIGKREQLRKTIADTKDDVLESKRQLHRYEQAQEVMRLVSIKTQEQLQYHISDITTLALESIFDEPYELIAEFIERRNKTECDLSFVKDTTKIDPLSASGGGAVDVAAFALRVASWTMQHPRSRNVLILDEPFRYLSSGLLPRASELLKELSTKLGLQIIMVTHSNELIESADKTFTVKQQKGVTYVS